jgi:hypothetical protein
LQILLTLISLCMTHVLVSSLCRKIWNFFLLLTWELGRSETWPGLIRVFSWQVREQSDWIINLSCGFVSSRCRQKNETATFVSSGIEMLDLEPCARRYGRRTAHDPTYSLPIYSSIVSTNISIGNPIPASGWRQEPADRSHGTWESCLTKQTMEEETVTCLSSDDPLHHC